MKRIFFVSTLLAVFFGTFSFALAATCTNLSSDLSYGMNDSSVLALQSYLVSTGYLDAAPNGNFGPATFASVIAFKQRITYLRPAMSVLLRVRRSRRKVVPYRLLRRRRSHLLLRLQPRHRLLIPMSPHRSLALVSRQGRHIRSHGRVPAIQATASCSRIRTA